MDTTVTEGALCVRYTGTRTDSIRLTVVNRSGVTRGLRVSSCGLTHRHAHGAPADTVMNTVGDAEAGVTGAYAALSFDLRVGLFPIDHGSRYLGVAVSEAA